MGLRLIDNLERFFTGHVFAAFMIGVLLLGSLFMGMLLVVPITETPFGAFVSDFKEWCFNYDPASGQMNWAYVAVMILNPLMLIGIVAGIWWNPLGVALKEERGSLATTAAAALVAVVALSAGLWLMGPTEVPDQELPFPAERLRTTLEPPSFDMWNQNGEQVKLSDLRGRVVLVTAVYATCHTACPTIITALKRTVDKLSAEEKAKLTVVAITLDPRNDTRQRLAATTEAHSIEAPLFNLVNADDPDTVERVLDAFNFSRTKNEETGEIDHANMFVLIDAGQKIAFRLTLGDRHQNWLETALRVLLREV